MTSLATVSPFRAAFDSLGDAAERPEAIERFEELGLPTTRHEEWRFTNVAELGKTSFAPGRAGDTSITAADAARLATAPGLVFVDGHYRADLSQVPVGVAVQSLAAALAADQGVRVLLDEAREPDHRAFAALNDAFYADGVFLRVPKNTKVAPPIHVLFIGTRDAAGHPRNVYLLEEGSEATVVESYVSAGDDAHFTNPVTEISVSANASLHHYKLQCENTAAFHVATMYAWQGRDSRFTSHNITLGGRLTRNDIVATLDAEGIVTTLNGLFLAGGTQHVDNHTWIEHKKPHCESHELYKGIVDDRASGVFSGYIHVFPDAQKTDAYQSSKNLLLTDEAIIDSQPQLEIYADDVKCSHGSTTGQMDKDALFYLRSRGIPEAAAQGIMVRAFANDVTNRIEEEAARARVNAILTERLGDAG